jgi:hypothetical protein
MPIQSCGQSVSARRGKRCTEIGLITARPWGQAKREIGVRAKAEREANEKYLEEQKIMDRKAGINTGSHFRST